MLWCQNLAFLYYFCAKNSTAIPIDTKKDLCLLEGAFKDSWYILGFSGGFSVDDLTLVLISDTYLFELLLEIYTSMNCQALLGIFIKWWCLNSGL